MGLLDMLEGITNTSSAPTGSTGCSGYRRSPCGYSRCWPYKTMKGQGPLGDLLGGSGTAGSPGTGNIRACRRQRPELAPG